MAKLPIKRTVATDRKAVAALKKLLANKSNELSWHHDVGRLVEQLVPEKRTHGDKKMTTLLAQLGIPDENQDPAAAYMPLYSARNFFRKYKKKDLSSLKGLEFGHVNILAGIKDDKIREKFLGMCLKREWSMRELRGKVQEKIGKRSAGGRPFKEVKDVGPTAALRKLQWLRDVAVKKLMPALEQNREQLVNLMNKKAVHDLVTVVDAARAALENLHVAAQGALVKLQEGKKNKRGKKTSKARR